MRDSVEVPQKREVKRERFEFEFTVNGNMICQRYFKINNFKERSLCSWDFYDAVQECVKMIKDDLVSKSNAYMEHMAPQIFNSEEEMRGYLFNEDGTPNLSHTKYLSYGRHIMLRGKNTHEYVWGGDKLIDEGVRSPEVTNEFVDEDTDAPSIFKFSVFDNGYEWFNSPNRREVASVAWDGSQYPRFVRNAVDISNGRGKYDDFDITKASHEQCLYYWCYAGRQDLVPIIIKTIAETCSYEDKNDYVTTAEYGKVVYENKPDLPGPEKEYPYKRK